jgi:hypothetical protein
LNVINEFVEYTGLDRVAYVAIALEYTLNQIIPKLSRFDTSIECFLELADHSSFVSNISLPFWLDLDDCSSNGFI